MVRYDCFGRVEVACNGTAVKDHRGGKGFGMGPGTHQSLTLLIVNSILYHSLHPISTVFKKMMRKAKVSHGRAVIDIINKVPISS